MEGKVVLGWEKLVSGEEEIKVAAILEKVSFVELLSPEVRVIGDGLFLNEASTAPLRSILSLDFSQNMRDTGGSRYGIIELLPFPLMSQPKSTRFGGKRGPLLAHFYYQCYQTSG